MLFNYLSTYLVRKTFEENFVPLPYKDIEFIVEQELQRFIQSHPGQIEKCSGVLNLQNPVLDAI